MWGRPKDLWPLSLNLEYLTNRVDDLGQINGKARFRASVERPSDVDPDESSPLTAYRQSRYRQSLYAHLKKTLRSQLTHDRCFILVSDDEPRHPGGNARRNSEFNAY